MTQFLSRRRLKFTLCKIVALLVLSAVVLSAQSMKSYQAEDADLYKAKTETEHSGFSGNGYVNFNNESGSYIEFTVFMVDTGTQTVYIRYANGATSARPMEVAIDSNPLDGMPAFIPTDAWTNWVMDSIEVFLVSGANKIRFTSSTSDSGPNIDKIDVTGTPGIAQYTIEIDVIGAGTVESTPSETVFEEGATVELHAIPDSGWQFLEWWGDTSGTTNSLSIVMNSNKQITAVFISEFDISYQFENSPIGFASLDTLGQKCTYGGEGGDTIIVETGEELFQILDVRRDPRFDQNFPPLVLLINGMLTWTTEEMMDLKENYDLTILGNGNYAIIEGFGLNIFRSHNIIIRNIEFRDSPDDCINITDSLSHHIWIDHCTFSDSPDIDPGGNRHDGLLDIKHGASFITVSWKHFYNHQKTALLGHSDGNADEDIGRLKVTYHHNWWDNTGSRHPRIRFGEVHVFNNFYDNSEGNMGYGIASTMEADVVVEANYFRNVGHPIHVGYGDSEEGDAVEINNIYENCGEPETRGTAFNPSDYYEYQPDDPAVLPTLLINLCGVGKMGEPVQNIVEKSPESLPNNYILTQNYPNPFNPVTSITYRIPASGWINLNVYDLAGRNVARLLNEYKVAGGYSLKFDASDLSSGIYVYRLEAEGHSLARKMILMK